MPGPPGLTPAGLTPAGLTAAGTAGLLRWAADHGRGHLLWRRTRDPWAVLVSETMLQQTQVARVVGRWEAFLDRFPTPAACAAAGPGEVTRAWAGLGYNRRAVALHGAARAVVERHGGKVPGRLGDLVALPGVGPYTARAVLAFAFEADVGVVDTNAGRVLARAAAGRALGTRAAQDLADGLVPPGRSWEWNSAVLDLGALVCVATTPRCDRCPLAAAGACAWTRAGRGGADPAAGSAGTGRRQSRFAGSEREGRGRLVAALRRGPVALVAAAEACGWPGQEERAAAAVAGLVADGLAVVAGDSLVLP